MAAMVLSAREILARANVRFGSKADIAECETDVRFTAELPISEHIDGNEFDLHVTVHFCR